MGAPMRRLTCTDCSRSLSHEEMHYYTGRCGDCELAWSDRVNACRFGSEDPELDALYGGPSPPKH
jgi:hypothetical protein